MLPLELTRILGNYDGELTFQMVKMCGVRGAVEKWGMGSWCLVCVQQTCSVFSAAVVGAIQSLVFRS